MKRYYTINTNIKFIEINKFKYTYTLPSTRSYNEFCIELNNVLYSLDPKFNYNIEFCVFMHTSDPNYKLLPSYVGINKELDREKTWLVMVERTDHLLSKYKRYGYYRALEFRVRYDEITEEKGWRREDCVETMYRGLAGRLTELTAGPQKDFEEGKRPEYGIDPDRAVVMLIHKKVR